MARDFSKNTSNYIAFGVNTIGSLINGASAVSVHEWINADTYDTGTTNNRVFSAILSGSNNALRMCVDGSTATKKLQVGARSVSGDSLQTALGTSNLGTGTWRSVGLSADYPADTLKAYVDGTAETTASVTWANTTYTNSSAATDQDNVGANFAPPGTTGDQFDGKIAEVAVWNVDIGAAGFAALAKGYSALLVRPESLVFYMPLHGNQTPEYEIIGGARGEITGSVPKADHPRIIYPKGLWSIDNTTAAAGGGSPQNWPILRGSNFWSGRF